MNSPTLVVIVDDKSVTGALVVGFRRTMVELHGERLVKRGLLALVGAYFCLDFDYPLGYSVMLKFLQHYLMGRKVKDLPKTVSTLCSKAGVTLATN